MPMEGGFFIAGSPRLILPICIAFALAGLAGCSSDNPSENSSGEQIALLYQAVRDYDLTIESTMDQLLALKRLRVDDTSWAEKYLNLPNPLAGGLGNVGSESWFKSREDAWVEWRRLTRDELRDELAFLKSHLSTLEHNHKRVLEVGVPIEDALHFRLRAIPAMNRLESVIKEVAIWYEEYMTDNTNQTLQRSKPLELVPLLADAPTLFIDARLRWVSAKADLP